MLSFLLNPPAIAVIFGGVVIFALTVVQMLIGYRKIHFKGRKHLKVHKIMGWVIVAGAMGHGLVGLLYLGILG